MDPGQGLLVNTVTRFPVIFASKWGLPVSTAHVSCGALDRDSGDSARLVTHFADCLPVVGDRLLFS